MCPCVGHDGVLYLQIFKIYHLNTTRRNLPLCICISSFGVKVNKFLTKNVSYNFLLIRMPQPALVINFRFVRNLPSTIHDVSSDHLFFFEFLKCLTSYLLSLEISL